MLKNTRATMTAMGTTLRSVQLITRSAHNKMERSQPKEFVTGLKLARVSADLTNFVKGASWTTTSTSSYGSRAAPWTCSGSARLRNGNENALRLRVYGARTGLKWGQEKPNTLRYTPYEEPTQAITRGSSAPDNQAGRMTPLPPKRFSSLRPRCGARSGVHHSGDPIVARRRHLGGPAKRGSR